MICVHSSLLRHTHMHIHINTAKKFPSLYKLVSLTRTHLQHRELVHLHVRLLVEFTGRAHPISVELGGARQLGQDSRALHMHAHRYSGQTGSEGRYSGQTGSQVRQSGQTGSQVRHSGQPGSEGTQAFGPSRE